MHGLRVALAGLAIIFAGCSSGSSGTKFFPPLPGGSPSVFSVSGGSLSAGTMTVTVVDPFTGNPLAGVSVFLGPDGTQGSAQTQTSSTAGIVTFVNLTGAQTVTAVINVGGGSVATTIVGIDAQVVRLPLAAVVPGVSPLFTLSGNMTGFAAGTAQIFTDVGSGADNLATTADAVYSLASVVAGLVYNVSAFHLDGSGVMDSGRILLGFGAAATGTNVPLNVDFTTAPLATILSTSFVSTAPLTAPAVTGRVTILGNLFDTALSMPVVSGTTPFNLPYMAIGGLFDVRATASQTLGNADVLVGRTITAIASGATSATLNFAGPPAVTSPAPAGTLNLATGAAINWTNSATSGVGLSMLNLAQGAPVTRSWSIVVPGNTQTITTPIFPAGIAGFNGPVNLTVQNVFTTISSVNDFDYASVIDFGIGLGMDLAAATINWARITRPNLNP